MIYNGSTQKVPHIPLHPSLKNPGSAPAIDAVCDMHKATFLEIDEVIPGLFKTHLYWFKLFMLV
jgi:hypothetical protein